MYDQSFNAISLSSQIRKSDFRKIKDLRTVTTKDQHLQLAHTRSENGFHNYAAFRINSVKKKNICTVLNFSDELVLRKINSNLIRAAKIRNTDRDSIIKNIRSLLREGTEYRVYRLDIKSFYESILHSSVDAQLNELKYLSDPTKRHIQKLLDSYSALGHSGLPRGLAISASLSEIIMKDFDLLLARHPSVFFYSRYVDDMIIITNGAESRKKFTRWINKNLPDNLNLNYKKQLICECEPTYKDTNSKYNIKSGADLSFEFLGYEFKVTPPSKTKGKTQSRDVRLDIAKSKVKKIKTRLIKAIIEYCKDSDHRLLEDRISFLCSNFGVIDADRDRKRLAGIHHNYHQIDHKNSTALKELDSFLCKVICSGHGKVADEFFQKTKDTERRKLLKWSFHRGFTQKVYINFSQIRLSQIQECWAYV